VLPAAPGRFRVEQVLELGEDHRGEIGHRDSPRGKRRHLSTGKDGLAGGSAAIESFRRQDRPRVGSGLPGSALGSGRHGCSVPFPQQPFSWPQPRGAHLRVWAVVLGRARVRGAP
jgi:hypothetical protein